MRNYIVLAVITAALSSIGFMLSTQYVYAPPTHCINCGASSLAPGQLADISPFPCEACAKDFAPGQLAEKPKPVEIPPQPCDACAKDFAPGTEGLEAGIIGPPKKIQ